MDFSWAKLQSEVTMTILSLRERQEKARKKMNSELRGHLDWIVDWCNNEDTNGLMRRWELGERVIQIRSDFGNKAISQIKLFIREDPSMLYKVEKFAEYYTKEEVEELVELSFEDGAKLSYSHVRLLISIENRNQRTDALNQTIDNNWTSTQLGKYIKDLLGKRSAGGRKPSIPKSAEAVIEQQLAFADDFSNRNMKVWDNPQYSLKAQLKDIEDPDEALTNRLGYLAIQLKQLVETAQERADEAEEQYQALVDKAKEPEPDVEDEDDEEYQAPVDKNKATKTSNVDKDDKVWNMIDPKLNKSRSIKIK